MSKAGNPNPGPVPLHKSLAVGESYPAAAAQTKAPAAKDGKDTK